MTSSGPHAPRPQRKLRLAVLLSAGIKVASAGLTFLMFVFLARALGPETYGRFAAMFSLGSFLGYIVLMGQHTRSVKRLSAWIEDRNLGRARKIILQSLSAVILFGSLLSLGLLGLAAALEFAQQSDHAATLRGSIFLIVPFALSELVAALFRAQGAIFFALAPRDIFWRALIIAMSVSAGPALLDGVSAETSIIIISAILLMLIVLQTLLLAWRLPREIWSTPSEPLPEGFWRDSSWFWIGSIIASMTAHLSVVFTSFNLSETETGAFFAAVKITLLLQLPLIAVSLVAGPMLARSYAKGDYAAMQGVCRSISVILLGTSTVGTLFIFIMPSTLLSFFDPAFVVAVPALIVLTLKQFIGAICGLSKLTMLMADGAKPQAYFTGASETLGLILIFVLAPLFGLLGVAIAVLIGSTLGKLLSVTYCYRRFGIDTSVFCILRKPKDV